MPLAWLLSRRSRPVGLATERDPLWRRHVPGRDKGGPGLAGFGVILGGSAGNRRNADQVLAVGALNLPAGCLFVALQVLFAVRTGQFEFAHRLSVLILVYGERPNPSESPRHHSMRDAGQKRLKKIWKSFLILFPVRLRFIWYETFNATNERPR